MNRRELLATAIALAAAPALPALGQSGGPARTRWNIVESEGSDAIAFLGPLSGGELYRRYYSADVDAFAPKLPAAIRADISKLYADSNASSFGLLAPVLSNVMSGLELPTVDSVIHALADPEANIRPRYQASDYWEPDDWVWLTANVRRLSAVFCRDFATPPHGAKMQGQTFVQAADYDTATTVRIAAHEMLHPPFPMEGPAAKAALAVLARDPLIPRIVRDHDPRWGYTTLDGILDEDMCQALDQLISEGLGVARKPADRWHKADDGMHVLAGGLYGLLRQDGWNETGGNLEEWLAKAAAGGRLAPGVLHPIAARVLERPVDRLWPLDPAA